MGKGPGPSTLERLFVANGAQTTSPEPDSKSTLTRFDIKTHTPTTPIKRSERSAEGAVTLQISAYKNSVYVPNFGLNPELGPGKTIDVFNASTGVRQKTWETSAKLPSSLAAYKDNVYVPNLQFNDSNDYIGTIVDVFDVSTGNGGTATKTWKLTGVGQLYGVAAYQDKIYVTSNLVCDTNDQLISSGLVEVFSTTTPNDAGPEKLWRTSEFLPIGIAAFNDKIYVGNTSNDNEIGDFSFFGNSKNIDVFDINQANDTTPEKTWETSEFCPLSLAAYKGKIYAGNTVQSLNDTDPVLSKNVDVFDVDQNDGQGPEKTWTVSDIFPVGISAYDDKIYVCNVGGLGESGNDASNKVDIFPVDAPNGSTPSETWTTDYGPTGSAAYNSEYPEGNLYIDASGSNVV